MALEAERACDDAVLERSEATAYADQLVGLARRLAARPAATAMANRSDLATRVRAVLDGEQRRGRAGRRAVMLAGASAALAAMTIAPLQVATAAPPAAQETVADSSGPAVEQVMVNSFLVVETVAVLDQDGRSVEGLGARDFSVTEDGAPQTISIFEFQKMDGDFPGYYRLGYYTRNQNADGRYRKIQVTGKDARMAKLDYRQGYYGIKSFGWKPSGIAAPVVPPGVTPPVILHKFEPEYSEEARKAKYQGTVRMRVEVDTDGRVRGMRVVRSLGLGLDECAADAVKQWRFKPGMESGRPASMPVDVDVNFRLL
jgi:TonB family protein